MNLIGFWFELLKEVGEDISIEYAIVDPTASKSPILSAIGHDQVDGLALIQKIGEENFGADLIAPAMKPEYHCPSLLKIIFEAIKFHFLRSQTPVPWKERFPYERGRVLENHRRTHLILSEKVSYELLSKAKNNGYGLNGLISKHFDQLVREFYLQDSADYNTTYMLPVNLRGGHPKLEGGNQAAYIDLSIAPSATIPELDQQLRSKLASFRPWSVYWTAIWVAKYAPNLARKWVRQHFNEKPPPVVGSLSNLGRWDITQVNSDRIPIIWGTVSWVRPLAFIYYLWQGHLVLSLKAHPSLVQSDQQLDSFMEKFQYNINQL